MLFSDLEKERVFLHHDVLKNRILLSLQTARASQSFSVPLHLRNWVKYYGPKFQTFIADTDDCYRFLLWNEPGIFEVWSLEYRKSMLPHIQEDFLYLISFEKKMKALYAAFSEVDLILKEIVFNDGLDVIMTELAIEKVNSLIKTFQKPLLEF